MNDEPPNRRKDIDDPFHFVRYVDGPDGQLFRIEVQKEFGVVGPVALFAPGGSLIQLLTRLVNAGLGRAQRHTRSYERFVLAVKQVGGQRDDVIVEESFSEMGLARQRAEALTAQVEGKSLGE
jgi:hypothetical protein